MECYAAADLDLTRSNIYLDAMPIEGGNSVSLNRDSPLRAIAKNGFL